MSEPFDYQTPIEITEALNRGEDPTGRTATRDRDAELARLRGEVERLTTRLRAIEEPGMQGARYAALEKLAEPMGYTPTSSRPVELFIAERIERAEALLIELMELAAHHHVLTARHEERLRATLTKIAEVAPTREGSNG